MRLIEVSSKATIRAFLALPARLHKDTPWIRPLNRDIESVFDPEKNKLFRNGEATRWILKNDSGTVIGRVAAFVNRKGIKENALVKAGGMGFFECIDDQAAANVLFDACKTWLEERGLNAMDGPINFGDRDRWWGLLTDGFEIEPNYCMPWTPPHYQQLFETYGFQVYFKQYTYSRPVNERMQDAHYEKARRIFADPRYTFSILDLKNLDKYAEDFASIYNASWGKHVGVGAVTLAQAKQVMRSMKAVVDPRIVYYAYYEGKPAAFFIILPELNQVFKHVPGGRLDLLGKLIFLWHHKIAKTNKKMFGVIFGVVPEHQGKGLDAGIVEYCRQYVQEKIRGRYEEFEMNWVGDFNPKMMKVAERIGRIAKTHHTYRIIFDPSIPFERMPVIR